MAKRETFTESFHCPNCEKAGSATWEENENPMHAQGRLDRELKSASTGFIGVRRKACSEDPVIVCRACNIDVVIG